MYSHIKNKNDRIKEAYKLIEDNKRIILYIAYFQPFLKFMGPYQRVMALNELKKMVKEQQEQFEIHQIKQLKLEKEINKMEQKEIYIKQKLCELMLDLKF